MKIIRSNDFENLEIRLVHFGNLVQYSFTEANLIREKWNQCTNPKQENIEGIKMSPDQRTSFLEQLELNFEETKRIIIVNEFFIELLIDELIYHEVVNEKLYFPRLSDLDYVGHKVFRNQSKIDKLFKEYFGYRIAKRSSTNRD